MIFNSVQFKIIKEIEHYLNLISTGREQYKLPVEYIEYLKYMGKSDDGLLEDYIKGSTNIEVIIEYIEEVNKHPDFYNEIDTDYIVFGHSIESEVDIVLIILIKNEYKIV